jgi:DNA-binding NtrC family response regulator
MKALQEAGGNKTKAAKILNMNERTFYRKIKNLGL